MRSHLVFQQLLQSLRKMLEKSPTHSPRQTTHLKPAAFNAPPLLGERVGVRGQFALAVSIIFTVLQTNAVEIIAHRGASYDAPENTLASVRLGYEQGADGVEIDIHLTKDNRAAVLHDYDTARVSGAKLVVSNTPLADLQKLNVGAWGKWTNQPFNEKIATLEDVLALVPAGKKLFIEIKTGPEIIPAVAQALKNAKPKPDQLTIITFNYESAKAAKKTFPKLKTYWLVGYAKDKVTGEFPKLDETIAKAKAAGVDGLDLNFNWPLDKTTIAKIKSAGLECHVWTVNDPAKARELATAGVDSITTDRPKWLRDQLK